MRPLLLLALTAALAGCGGDEPVRRTQPLPTAAARTPPAGPCTTLSAGSGEVQATGATRQLLVSATNTGSAPCSLTGHGGTVLLDAAGAALPTQVEEVQQPATVVLPAGGSAVRELAWTGTEACVEAAGIRLVLPGQPTGPVVELPVTVCGALRTSPWGQTLEPA